MRARTQIATTPATTATTATAAEQAAAPVDAGQTPRWLPADRIAPTLQAALDEGARCEPGLCALAWQMVEGEPLSPTAAPLAPLARPAVARRVCLSDAWRPSP